jgi:methylase of polypeptide subunit release factors
MKRSRTTGPNQWTIRYASELDGGGTGFGLEYVDLVRERYGPVNHLFEWCSGPAFIGYNLLDHQLARQLTASDIYKPAIDSVKQTRDMNRIANGVEAYNVGKVSDLPLELKFDLVVANPPHFLKYPGESNARRYVDSNWHIHEEFFANIASYLAPNARILLQENQLGSPRREREFARAIKSSPLRITDVFNSRVNYNPDKGWYIYYIELAL